MQAHVFFVTNGQKYAPGSDDEAIEMIVHRSAKYEDSFVNCIISYYAISLLYIQSNGTEKVKQI